MITTAEAVIEFLRARYDEEEALAGLAEDQPGLAGPEYVPGAGRVLIVGAARVLAEVEAKRAVLDAIQLLESQVLDGNLWNVTAHEVIPEALATVYADHPDYPKALR